MTAISDLDGAARETLRLIGPPPDDWVVPRADVDHDVLIVGGGQNGVAIAFALRRAGIHRVAVIDAAPQPAQAGGWRTRARMQQLRTPKNLVGPELSLPALGFQAWYEARHGREAYAALERIPRTDWADFLDWQRRLFEVDVQYGTRLIDVNGTQASDGLPLLRVGLDRATGREQRVVRTLVLATGVDGSGAAFVPEVLQPARAAGRAFHTADAIDFTALRGRRVAVVGGAASAFDAAGAALEAGVAELQLFVRREQIAATPVIRARSYPGYFDHYAELPDAVRWFHAQRYRRLGSTPPPDAIQRVLKHPNFRLHLASRWHSVTLPADGVVAQVQQPGGLRSYRFDHVIAGTGYRVDLALRPELAAVAPHVLRWRDRYAPPAEERDDELGFAPYLGPGLQLQERTPGQAPWVRRIHVVNPGGFASVGLPLGDVPSMRRDLPALVSRISHDLLLADLPAHERRVRADVPPDFGPELYAQAVAR